MVLKEASVKFQLDSGATINILPVEFYQAVQKDPELIHLRNTKTTLVMFNNSELKPLGTCNCRHAIPRMVSRTLLSMQWLQMDSKHFWVYSPYSNLALCQSMFTTFMCVNLVTLQVCPVSSQTTKMSVGQGKLEEKLHLTLDKSVAPVIMPVRKVPIAIKEPLKKEIDRLVGQDILKPIDMPTDWISSKVVVMKSNGKIPLCKDPKPLNQA